MGCSYRLAVLADIHGNGAAFESVLAHIDQGGPVNAILVAGDIIGGPDQEAVLRSLQERKAVCIPGNWERTVLDLIDGRLPGYYSTACQFSLYRWSRDHLSPEMLVYLRSMPEQIIFYLPEADPIRIVHGSPEDINEKIRPEKDPARLAACLANISEPVIVFGHIHYPWLRHFNGQIAFNPGAVSFARGGTTNAQYAILEWRGHGWQMEHHSIPYDLHQIKRSYRVSGILAANPLGRAFVYGLETGRDVGRAFYNFACRLAEEAGYKSIPYIPDAFWEKAERTFDWDRFAPGGKSHGI